MQMAAYEMRISDWSSDVCSSDLSSVLVYMTVYIVMTLGSFMVVIRMRDEEGRQIETIASLSGMSKTRPGLALAFMAFMFSLAGIPPLFGFYPKLAVFNAPVAAGLLPLAVLAVVGSVHGAYYYMRKIGRASGRDRWCQYV